MPSANQLPKISPADFYAANKSAIDHAVSEIGSDLESLLCVMHFETAGTYAPNVKNPYSGAVGLIQFTKGAAKDLGTSRTALEKMTVSEQLSYVVAYFKLPNKRAPYLNVEDLYLAVFYPAARKYAADTVVISKQNAPQTYANNRGLDKNGDGNIYKHEITSRIKSHYEQWFSSPAVTIISQDVPVVTDTDKPSLNDTAASEAQQGKILDGDYLSQKKKSL